MSDIRNRPTDESQRLLNQFANEFYELTGVEWPPQNRAQWLDVFIRAGYSQTQARQAYGDVVTTAEHDGTLDADDLSTSESSGDNPTFTPTMMAGLREAALRDGGYFTEEDRQSGEWCIIFGMERDPPTALSRQAFSMRRRGTKGKLIRCIESKPQRYKVHIDDLPSGTKSLPLRNDIVRNHGKDPSA